MWVLDILKSEGCKKVDSIEFCGVSFDVYESQTEFYCIYEFNGCADKVMSLYSCTVKDLYHAEYIFKNALIYMVDYNESYMRFCWLNMLGGYVIKKYTIDKLDDRLDCMNALREYNQYEIVEGAELESVIARLPDGALDAFHDPKVYRCFNGEDWHYMVINGYTWS